MKLASTPTVLVPSRALIATALLAGCARSAEPPARPANPAPAVPGAPSASPNAAVIHVDGERLVMDGRPIELRGVAFGNHVWQDDRIPSTHHDERDYARIAELGMNAVRFYMNYRTFENDAAPGEYAQDGFQWLDTNIAWAKRHGVYLILNMHVPPGGYQSLGGGKALWREASLQERFIALWRAIAQRYATEPTIAGYDLLNEPVVDREIGQWKGLAERTIAAIRTVDPNHAVFVERVNSVGNDWAENADRNFFRVSDPNVVYEFHFYKPFHFTHQGARWVDFAAASGRYPDEKVAEVEWFLAHFETGTFESPKLPAGNSDWRYYEGRPFTVTNAKLAVGKPTLSCARVGAGRAFFDDLLLERLDAQGKPAEQVWRENLDTPRGWYLWEKTPKGSRALAKTGHGDQSSLSVTGTVDDANLGADYLRFRPRVGATYRLSGWMKGEQIPPQANCQIRLDFLSASVPVQNRDRAFLEQEMGAYLSWGKRQHVPLFLGEFGAIHAAFDGDRGGERWAADMLEIALANQLSFTYHDYHEDDFGLYFGNDGLPDENNRNVALIDVFREKLAKVASKSTRQRVE